MPDATPDVNSKEIADASSSSQAASGTGATSGTSSQDSSGVSSATTISSLSDLKNIAPQLYNFMMQSLAQNICIQMQQDSDRLTKIMKQMGEREPFES